MWALQNFKPPSCSSVSLLWQTALPMKLHFPIPKRLTKALHSLTVQPLCGTCVYRVFKWCSDTVWSRPRPRANSTRQCPLYNLYRFIKPTLAKTLAYSFCETFSLWEECVSKVRIFNLQAHEARDQNLYVWLEATLFSIRSPPLSNRWSSSRTCRRVYVHQPSPESLACSSTCRKEQEFQLFLDPRHTEANPKPSIPELSPLPHGSTELLVRHAAVLLLLPPQLSHGFGLEELEYAIPSVLPLHQTLVLLRVNQDISDKLPKVGSSWSCN